MRVLFVMVVMALWANVFALQSIKSFERYNQKGNGTPCVQAFLNAEPLNSGTSISKKTKGLITVTKDNLNKIYFNVTLKSNIGKKDEPPVYLRFIKQKQLDIAELLEYAEDGDEIYIEPYVSSLNKIDLNCAPASITVGDNL